MPYIVKPVKGGFKVCKETDRQKCFSNHPLPLARAKRQKTAIIISQLGGADHPVPENPELYQQIKQQIYQDQPKHSLFRSAQIAKQYKKQGGTWTSDIPRAKSGIQRWFKEKWISVNDWFHNQTEVPCGSADTGPEYPVCRPIKQVKKMSQSQLKTLIDHKHGPEPVKTPTQHGGAQANLPAHPKLIKQLEEAKLTPTAYLNKVKQLAKQTNYDPSKVRLSEDGQHKLVYESPEGLKRFGKVGYGDWLIWSSKEKHQQVPKGYANMKRRVFRRSHQAMSRKFNLTKYSENELAINLLW